MAAKTRRKAVKKSDAIIPIGHIEQRILLIRGERIILAADLARLYGVPVRQLNQAVRRNIDRFPEDFVFQLSKAEAAALLRAQFVTLNKGDASRSRIATSSEAEILKSQSVISSWGGARRALPYAFTEHGVVMAANVLRSGKAAKVSVFVVRAFVKLRQMLANSKELAHKLDQLERKLQDHDTQILSLVQAIRQLMRHPDDPPKPPIGYDTESKGRR